MNGPQKLFVILIYIIMIYKYKTVEQWLCSWYQSACFFLIKASGWNIELSVKLTFV